MNTKKFTSHRVFMAWEYDKEEKYLNEMSRKGWQVVKGGCFHTEFEKRAGTAYRYCLDYNPEAMKDAGEKARYVETFADGGWEFINATYNGWVYLRKEIKEGMSEQDFEIYSDKESILELFERLNIMFRTLCFVLAVCLCLEIYLFVRSGLPVTLLFTAIVLALFIWMLYGTGRLKKIRQRLAYDR